jgi:hypothetical protein
MGTKGFYPLFEAEWLSQSHLPSDELAPQERDEGMKILQRLNSHRGIERKKTILLTLTPKQRAIIVKLFFSLVEEKIDHQKGVIQ